MIIYCAGPIKGDITYQEKYREIISIVESLGHTALSEFSSKMPSMILLNDKQIYTRDIKWLDGSKNYKHSFWRRRDDTVAVYL